MYRFRIQMFFNRLCGKAKRVQGISSESWMSERMSTEEDVHQQAKRKRQSEEGVLMTAAAKKRKGSTALHPQFDYGMLQYGVMWV